MGFNMRKSQFFIICSLLLTGAILFTTMTNRQEAQDRSKSEQDDATPIQLGKMSERQRQHANLYQGYGTGKKLSDLVKQHGKANVVRGPALESGNPFAPTVTRGERVGIATCASDAIVTGTVISKESQLTSDGEFVFTDYEVRVEIVANNQIKNSLKMASMISVSRPGGAVSVDGHLVTARDLSNPPLVVGHTYFFFLKNIRATGAYSTERINEISSADQRLGGLGRDSADDFFNDSDVSLAIAEVRLAANECSNKWTHQ